MQERVICALDTPDLEAAIRLVRTFANEVGAFKVGHALTLPHGLEVLARLRDAGAERIFLDLKFHDIPHTVELAVREAGRYGAWMTTVHLSGGREMLGAARGAADESGGPLVVGVGVLTSLDEAALRGEVGVERTVADHLSALVRLGSGLGLDGFVCSPREVRRLREEIGAGPLLVVPGIRLAGGDLHDQVRTGDATTAIADGADYLVVGRALTEAPEPGLALAALAA